MSAANIDDPRERSEIIGFGDGLVGARSQGDHGAMEQGGLLRVLRQPVKPWAPEHLIEDRPSNTDGMKEPFEGEIGLAVDHADEVTGTRLIGAQHGANPSQLEMTRLNLP